MHTKSLRRSVPTLMMSALLVDVPRAVLGKSVFDWIERPLDSLWKALESDTAYSEHISEPLSQAEESIKHKQQYRQAHKLQWSESFLEHDTGPPLPGTLVDDESHSSLYYPPQHSHSLQGEPNDRDSLEYSTMYPDQDEDSYDHDSDMENDPITTSFSSSNAPILVYRFYSGKPSLSARTTRNSPTSIPFLCIGPNVDHWKPVAQELTSRGYHVLACERIQESSSNNNINTLDKARENAQMIQKLLNALRWSQVVLVGCDTEALIAIQAAQRLAPQRVVGLILCGNLEETSKYIAVMEEEYMTQRYHGDHPLAALTTQKLSTRKTSPLILDRFLMNHIKCPFRIVWDGVGSMPPWNSPGKEELASPSVDRQPSRSSWNHAHDKSNTRCQIIGGGSAPHRRRPEQFAWMLSRFIEEHVVPSNSYMTTKAPSAPRARGGQQPPQRQEANTHGMWRRALAEWRDKLFSPFSFTVGGRLVATTIFYTICLKVAIYQFENFRIGFNTISLVRRRIVSAVGSIISALTLSQRANESPSANTSGQSEEDGFSSAEKDPTSTPTEESGEDEDRNRKSIRDVEIPEEKQPMEENRFRPAFFLDHVIA